MSQSSPIAIRSTPRAIFRALLTPASLRDWWGCTAVIDARAGGAWVGGWGEGPDGLGQETVIWASIAELVPNARLVLQMGDTQIGVDIRPHPQGAEVTVSQTGYPADDPQQEAAALQSWVDMVRSLQAWVEREHPYVPPASAPARAQPQVPAQPQAQAQPRQQPQPQAQAQAQAAQPSSGQAAAAAASEAPLSDPYGAASALADGGPRVLDDGGFGVTDPHAVIKSWSKEQGFGYVTHPQLGDVVFDYDGCDFEPAPGDKVLLLVIAKAWNGKPKVKRIACPAKGSKLDK